MLSRMLLLGLLGLASTTLPAAVPAAPLAPLERATTPRPPVDPASAYAILTRPAAACTDAPAAEPCDDEPASPGGSRAWAVTPGAILP